MLGVPDTAYEASGAYTGLVREGQGASPAPQAAHTSPHQFRAEIWRAKRKTTATEAGMKGEEHSMCHGMS